MDNNTPEILKKKCELFDKLYNNRYSQQSSCGSGSGSGDFVGSRVSDQYMCPDVGQQMPSNNVTYAGCFAKQPLLGKYNVCDGQEQQLVEKRSTENIATTPDNMFLPERLNSLTKDNVMSGISDLYNNPDFVYSANMIKNGAEGLKYYVQNKVQSGGAGSVVQSVGDSLSNLVKHTTTALAEINNVVFGKAEDKSADKSADKSLVKTGGKSKSKSKSKLSGGYAEQAKSVATVMSSVDKVKNDLSLLMNVITEQIGAYTPADILSLLQTNASPVVAETANKVTQAGGMVYSIVSNPIYDEDQYYNKIMGLFDELHSTVGYVINSFKVSMVKNGAPDSVLHNVESINRGLNLCLQIMRHYLLNDNLKKKNFIRQ